MEGIKRDITDNLFGDVYIKRFKAYTQSVICLILLVASHTLKFVPPILDLGNKVTQRIWSKGPYVALHLRMEKDAWVRTSSLPGLGHEYDEIINNERILRPELLTSRSKVLPIFIISSYCLLFHITYSTF